MFLCSIHPLKVRFWEILCFPGITFFIFDLDFTMNSIGVLSLLLFFTYFGLKLEYFTLLYSLSASISLFFCLLNLIVRFLNLLFPCNTTLTFCFKFSTFSATLFRGFKILVLWQLESLLLSILNLLTCQLLSRIWHSLISIP